MTAQMLASMAKITLSLQERFAFDLFVVEWFFMLRQSEASKLWPDDCVFLRKGETRSPDNRTISLGIVPVFGPTEVLRNDQPFRVRLRIRFEKMNQRGETKFRMLDCVCPPIAPGSCVLSDFDQAAKQRTEPPTVCPVHALARLSMRTGQSVDARFTMGQGFKPHGDHFLLNQLRNMLVNAGVPIVGEFTGPHQTFFILR